MQLVQILPPAKVSQNTLKNFLGISKFAFGINFNWDIFLALIHSFFGRKSSKEIKPQTIKFWDTLAGKGGHKGYELYPFILKHKVTSRPVNLSGRHGQKGYDLYPFILKHKVTSRPVYNLHFKWFGLGIQKIIRVPSQ